MPQASFVHLRVRSCFSLLESTIRSKNLVQRCVALGMPAVGIADRTNLFGAVQFCEHARKAGVQPIVGALIPVRAPEPSGRALARAPEPEPLVLLVKDAAGYRNLLHLLTLAYLGVEPGTTPQVGLDDLAGNGDGLICLTGGPEGPLGAALQRGDQGRAAAVLEALRGTFDDRLYIELMRHELPAETVIEPALVDLAFSHGLPLVATNDNRFLDEAGFRAHDALTCLAHGTQLAAEDRPRFSQRHRFRTAAEMAALFADLPEAVANTVVIARRCAFAVPARAPILPSFALDEEAEMRRQAAAGLEERLVQAVFREGMDAAQRQAAAASYRERLAYELDVVAQMRFAGYFLIVSDFIRWAKGQGIPVGPGRGSGAGSVVAWALEITDLDPLRFGLLFERFLNPERVSMPDFDIDFCEERRDEVIRYVCERYGADRVAQIITFGTLQARAALRDVGRVMGLPFGQVDRICKLVPINPANPVTLAQAKLIEPRLNEAAGADPQVAQMLEVALELEGLPRHASTHAAGVVIGDRPLQDLVPLYRDPRAPLPATQFNMKDVEKAGLVKFDFLGLSTLTMLRLAEELVRARGVPLELATLPLDDAPTYALLSRAESQGVFQLEGGGMRDALRRLKPDCFEDIIAMVSLYRPGPMDNIPRYTNVKHGLETPSYLHPLLEPILRPTNGVIIYQEQVMEIAQKLAGYSLGRADLLRRAMGKKIKAEMDAQEEVFVAGARENGLTPDQAQTIFEAVAKFASYGFNKSHAAAYALLAYQTAYLKANHPVEFYCAAMTTEIDSQEKLAAFRQEMRSRKIPLYPPDVNASAALFAVEDGEEGVGVRYALAAIKGVGRAAMEALAAERDANGGFADVFDLVARLGPRLLNKRLLESLARAGALDRLESNRRRVAAGADTLLRWAAAAADEAQSEQVSLFGGTGTASRPPTPRLPDEADWATLDRLQEEFAVLGLYLSAHPLDGYATVLTRLNTTPGDRLRDAAAAGNSPLRIAGIVLSKQERVTERTRLARVVLSDATAQVEVTLFSELLASARELIDGTAPLVIDVDARLEGDNLRLTAQRVQRLDSLPELARGTVEIKVAAPSVAVGLEPFLRRSAQAGARVRLVLATADAEEAVLTLPESFVLTHAQRQDVERFQGVLAVRDVATTMH